MLAGILIKVGTDIIDWDYLKRLKTAPKAGIVIMLAVLIITVSIDLLLAVGVGMVMASFLFMKRITDMQIASIKAVTNPDEIDHEIAFNAQEKEIMKQADGRIMLFHMSGPMSFSSAKSIVRGHAGIVGYEIMLLDLSDVPHIDFTTTRALEDIIHDTIDSGKPIFLVGACKSVYDMLEKQGVTAYFETDYMYQQRLDALLHAQSLLKN